MANEGYPLVIPMLDYEDGPAAMEWLARAFGFRELVRMMGDDGLLAHGEMAVDGGENGENGRIMLATATALYESPKHHREHCDRARAWSENPWIIDGVLVYVDDVDAHYARAVAAGTLDIEHLTDGSAVAAEKRLIAQRGIGTWTARYVMLRSGFGDALPVGDSALATALQHLHKLKERPGPDQTTQLMRVFSPYRSLATMHLWTALKEPGLKEAS